MLRSLLVYVAIPFLALCSMSLTAPVDDRDAIELSPGPPPAPVAPELEDGTTKPKPSPTTVINIPAGPESLGAGQPNPGKNVEEQIASNTDHNKPDIGSNVDDQDSENPPAMSPGPGQVNAGDQQSNSLTDQDEVVPAPASNSPVSTTTDNPASASTSATTIGTSSAITNTASTTTDNPSSTTTVNLSSTTTINSSSTAENLLTTEPPSKIPQVSAGPIAEEAATELSTESPKTVDLATTEEATTPAALDPAIMLQGAAENAPVNAEEPTPSTTMEDIIPTTTPALTATSTSTASPTTLDAALTSSATQPSTSASEPATGIAEATTPLPPVVILGDAKSPTTDKSDSKPEPSKPDSFLDDFNIAPQSASPTAAEKPDTDKTKAPEAQQDNRVTPPSSEGSSPAPPEANVAASIETRTGGRSFDAASFVGGIILGVAFVVIPFIVIKKLRGKKKVEQREYHDL